MPTDRWSDVFSWPIIGVHGILTPDEKPLTFGTATDGLHGEGRLFDRWDRGTETHQTLKNTAYTDIFNCAGVLFPETGRILIAGGDPRPFAATNNGVADVNSFDDRSPSLEEKPGSDVTYARRYPTTATLAKEKNIDARRARRQRFKSRKKFSAYMKAIRQPSAPAMGS